jgi:hypothetical protein
MKKHLYILLTLVLLAGCRANENSIQGAIEREREHFPQRTMQDVYKSFYQNRFGAEHMISDTAAVHAYLLYEIEVAAADSVHNPFYDFVGADGRYVRVYLTCVNNGKLTADQLFDAFIRSAVPAQQPEQSWADEWAEIEQVAHACYVPCTEEECLLLRQAAQDNRAVHHSEAYRNAYHPHYRIVRRDIFDNELAPLIHQY